MSAFLSIVMFMCVSVCVHAAFYPTYLCPLETHMSLGKESGKFFYKQCSTVHIISYKFICCPCFLLSEEQLPQSSLTSAPLGPDDSSQISQHPSMTLDSIMDPRFQKSSSWYLPTFYYQLQDKQFCSGECTAPFKRYIYSNNLGFCRVSCRLSSSPSALKFLPLPCLYSCVRLEPLLLSFGSKQSDILV